jgi:hypothetical protein
MRYQATVFLKSRNNNSAEDSQAEQLSIQRNFAATNAENRGEKAPVTQANACVSWLIQTLLWRCRSRLFCRMLDRTLSYHDRFGAKWRRRFRRKEWS